MIVRMGSNSNRFLRTSDPISIEGIEKYLGSGMFRFIEPESTPADRERSSYRPRRDRGSGIEARFPTEALPQAVARAAPLSDET